MTFLLDTNVISEVRKLRPDPQVMAWLDTVSSAEIFISVLTIGEIRCGIERLRRKDPAQAAALEDWLAGLRTTYVDRIVGVDARIAEDWGRLNVPDPVPVIDGLVAATAKCRGWTLVTRNTADLSRCDVRLLNPFGHVA
jgi:toxin FitB